MCAWKFVGIGVEESVCVCLARRQKSDKLVVRKKKKKNRKMEASVRKTLQELHLSAVLTSCMSLASKGGCSSKCLW